MVHRILFLHGAGPQPAANPLLQAVRRQWPDADLIAPALPRPEDPDPDLWQEAIGRVIRAIPDEPWVIVGHSLGGSEALRFLCHRIPTLLQRVVTVASPAWDPEDPGWSEPGFALPPTAGRTLADLEIVVVHAEDDDVVPPEHARRLGERLPSAHVVMLPSGGHLPTGWTGRGLIC
ncbi:MULTISPECIES: alpha/beta fold hydrolase [Kocuria]|jgi:predicted alpha/beta hydrolase family esterase|uniref:alpha/beta fold hydrolase n=1 Tax=Kocuria TaxID=57493 RepID=UPI00203E2842|nr:MULTISPECIES: alpha/beta fold hydrolase [Kocuria]MCM3686960.1 alpha/beta hydrolase [Kocuria rosea]HST71984.1 alpha/beta fold hydrolase [Kocuria rosea]